jgi:DNA repair exonuclease SbcCD ATPase subunit
MIIKKITVKRFRALRELKNPIRFFPGLNIVKGCDNEVGKSSLRIAITRTLFQDLTATSTDLQSLTSWGADEPWEVTMEFETEEGFYCIKRSFKDKKWELLALSPHEYTARNKETIAEKIAELTGCPTKTFFESTACIGQEEFIRIVPDNSRNSTDNPISAISQRLQAKINGLDGTDIPCLLAWLYARTHDKDATGPYFYLQRISEQTAVLRNQKQEQELKINSIMEKRQLFAQTSLELGEIERDLPPKLDLLEKNRKALALRKEIGGEKAQYDMFQKAKEFKAEVDRLDNEIEPVSHFADAEIKIKKLEDIESKIANLERQSIADKNEMEEMKRQEPATWILLAGAILIIGGLVGLLANPFLWIVSIVGLLLAAYWLISIRLWQIQKKAKVKKLNALKKEWENTRKEEQLMLQEFHSNSYDEFQSSLNNYRTKIGAKRDASVGLETLTNGKNWPKFVEENIDIDLRVGAEMRELQQLEPFTVEPQRLQQLESEVVDLQKRQTSLRQETGALEKFFEYSGTDRDQLTEIEEQLTDLEQQRKYYERQREVYELAHEIIEQALSQTLSRAADLMETEVSRYMALVTDGRYKSARVIKKENDLSIQTFSYEKNDWVDINELSRATQDQFYICARLALVKLITEGKKPVILLDDPFVNFHTGRLKNMMAILQEFARGGYQILLFTCSDAFDYLGKVVTIQ